MADDNFCIKLKFKLQGGSRDIYMIVNGDNEIGTVEKKKKEPADLVAIKTIEAHGILAVVDNMSSNAVIRFQGLQFPISGWLSRDQKDSSKFKWAIGNTLFWVPLNDNTWELQYQKGSEPEKHARLYKDGNDSWVLGITVDAEDYQEECIIFAALCLFNTKF